MGLLLVVGGLIVLLVLVAGLTLWRGDGYR
jgi:hypothetical protein